MKTSWLKGIEDEQRKEDIDVSFKASGLIRGRLAEILTGKIDAKFNSMTSEEAFKEPNWELKQAADSAYVRAMKEIISLITEKS